MTCFGCKYQKNTPRLSLRGSCTFFETVGQQAKVIPPGIEGCKFYVKST